MRKRNLWREKKKQKGWPKLQEKKKSSRTKKKELEKIGHMIGVCRNHLDVADCIVDLRNSTLKAVICSGKMNMAELVSAQAKIDMGLNRKQSI